MTDFQGRVINIRQKGGFCKCGNPYLYGPTQLQKFENDMLHLGEVRIDEYEPSVPELMKPAFDTLWNAGGFAGSQNYDVEGKWNPK